MGKIAENLEKVKSNITEACARSRRATGDVKLVVVTKSANVDAIKEVVNLGYSDLGENRVQHLKLVAEEIGEYLEQGESQSLPAKINWHMIGHLQRNKSKQVLKITDFIHSVDTLRLAEEIDKASAKAGVNPKILLQVNCSLEPQKYGVPVGAAVHLAEQIAEMGNVRLCGIMTMGPLTRDKDLVRVSFVRAREIFEEIHKEGFSPKDFVHMSMGMSADYEIAVEEGATILRVGSAIFS
ncbi:MAG: YggS family pyridoxal phosphate-dependent enzyme [Anaerohalosphaeraceae bacterium]|nr:YggS family pyridoxal phosphate-dependent enzyme [Anaerohalosphaeraceae bacterium]